MTEQFIAGYERVARQVPEGMIWQYRVVLRAGRLEHIWVLANEAGGIHVNAWASDPQWCDGRWIGGIEVHWPTTPEWAAAEKPHHEHCWVLGKPCWHDGSSLQFSEQIAPVLTQHTNIMDESDHSAVLSVMLSWHRSHFATLSTKGAA